jgi:ATPase subunit of ABC transporter with duplicated ATPase domains
VSWRAGERAVIEGLSFSLRGPERVALTGRNGAGKTTVLRLAAGLAAPTAGRIERPVPLALLDQTVSLLDRGATLVENMRRRNPDLTKTPPAPRSPASPSATWRATGRCAISAAANACAPVSPACYPARKCRNCCCSTSRPTISTSNPSK